MFNHVWKWAGDYRTTERNLGIAPYRIQPELHLILDVVPESPPEGGWAF